mgnify:CR=1 FL=1
MKKIYVIPATTVVKVGLTRMIAASPDGFSKELDQAGGSGDRALSRRGGSLWDDED